MLLSRIQTRSSHHTLVRAETISIFTTLTALSARITIPLLLIVVDVIKAMIAVSCVEGARAWIDRASR